MAFRIEHRGLRTASQTGKRYLNVQYQETFWYASDALCDVKIVYQSGNSDAPTRWTRELVSFQRQSAAVAK